MSDKHLHIISFDIPYPPSYGGVIDIFCKIKALKEEGVNIHLHCFEYGRERSNELEKYCESVSYYQRKLHKKYLFSSLPYIVVTRSSEQMMNRLMKDDYPILFEGLHCCYHLNDERLKDRIKIVRMHNIEHDYYWNLAKVESGIMKRLYFNSEARKLKHFEKNLNYANYIIAISPADTKELSERYKNVVNVTAFHPNEQININEGKGLFALYHGTLDVAENNEAALYLVNKIFNDISVPLVIAGNKASRELRSAVSKNKNIELKSDISTEEIYRLIKDAQINILPTFQATGIKLKLLAALYNGRYCVVNSPMVKDTGMESLCSIKDSVDEMKKEVLRLFHSSFNGEEKTMRETILARKFSNKQNVRQLTQLLGWNQ